MRCELLVSKLGRSSKPEPRFIVLTNKSVYIIKQAMVNKQLQIFAERTIPVGSIKFVSTSSLKDDWFALGVGSPQEPDPLINCIFKTEFFTQLRTVTRGAVNLQIGETLQYNKKPGKLATIKAVKDPQVRRDDTYKSSQIHTGPGEPPNSISKPTPKGRSVPGKAITSGGLLKKSAGGKLSQQARKPTPQAQPLPGQTTSRAPAAERVVPVPQPQQQQQQQIPMPVPQPVAALSNGTQSHQRNISTASSTASSVRAPPPPPPPPAAAPPKDPQFKALYDFTGQTGGELSLKAGEVIFISQKESNGKFPIIPITRMHPFLHVLLPSANALNRMVARPPPRRLSVGLDTRRLPRRSPRRSPTTPTTASRCIASPTTPRPSKNQRLILHLRPSREG